MTIVEATKIHRIKQISEYNSRKPRTNAMAPAVMPASRGPPKFLFRLSVEVLRHASSGPTPVRKSSRRATGMFTLLKKGAPTLIRDPDRASENTGKRVPERTAIQATSRSKLLNKKLDSRETMASSWFSLFR